MYFWESPVVKVGLLTVYSAIFAPCRPTLRSSAAAGTAIQTILSNGPI